MGYGLSYPEKAKYITSFQESIVLGGGGNASQTYNSILFSNAYDPFNFSQTGSGTDLAYVKVAADGGPITGIGIYSVTTADDGPKTELLIGKKKSCYKLRNLPTSFSSDTFMDVMSARVGICNHYTIENTDVGTMFASDDNVYLVNTEGEPIPVGDDISAQLKPEDPATGVDTSYWNACYHDGHYKLSYSVSASARPSKELWLNIMKMKAIKMQPVWVGPHIGRQIDYCFTDKVAVSGDREQRICVDITNRRIYQADKESVTQDFGSSIACVIETHDVVGENGMYLNKLHTCTQWKAKVDASISFTEQTYVDEALAETATLAMAPASGYTGGSYSAFLSGRTLVYTSYPTGRLRGREIRKRLSYTGTTFFSISGLSLYFKPERRRIDPR
jgi:hypothetical protein